jgi:hypothetical protein
MEASIWKSIASTNGRIPVRNAGIFHLIFGAPSILFPPCRISPCSPSGIASIENHFLRLEPDLSN